MTENNEKTVVRSRWETWETSHEWIEDICMNCGHAESAFSGPTICPKCGAIMENGRDGKGLMPRLDAEIEKMQEANNGNK